MEIKLSEVIGSAFLDVHAAIRKNEYTHYWLKGGRGSLKSSFASIEIIFGIIKDPNANAVVFRKVRDTMRESVYEQILWAIDKLGVSDYWHCTVSPLQCTYKPTGQKITFRGLDKAKKVKSIKTAKGYFKFVWFEEVDEFDGMEEIRSVLQSLLRGGPHYTVFYTYNPPKSQRNWVNAEVNIQRKDRLVHHTTYLQAPPEWLEEQFIVEAEHLKDVAYDKYRHEYLGEVTGTGAEVFTNLTIRKISDDEIKQFDKIKRGIDWGYAADPAHYGVMHFDKTRRRLYIFFEIHKVGMSNRALAEEIKKENKNNSEIIADSAEPKSIAEMSNEHGLKVRGAAKGPDSVRYGIKFLQDLEAIIIDPERCPMTFKEFNEYELEMDKEGNFKDGFPDKNNHSIDETRYALEDEIRSVKVF